MTSSSAFLKWGGSSDNVAIEGYRVYRMSPGNRMALIATTDAITSYTANYLRSAANYSFQITAIDAAGNESVPRSTTLTTLASSDRTAPTAPSSSSVALKTFSSSRIDVVWAASTSTDVASYQVFRDGTLVGTVERPNPPDYSDTGLAPSSSHSYTIRAVDSAGNVSTATTARVGTTTASGAVKIVRGPYLSNVTSSTAVVSWWTNIATDGTVAIAGQSVTDPAGSVQHHAVSVSGLAPGTTNSYTVSSGGVPAGGSLRTAASPGQSFSFAAIGDFGAQSTGESQNATNIGASGTQFIQTLGDNVYPSAGLPDPNFSSTYSDFDARFFKQFGPVVKSQAYFPANGNKEYYGNGEFWSAFPMPGTNHSWYSYNWGNAHILVLDSEQPYGVGTDQYNFAQNDLTAHQGDTWRIVAIQRPPYSSTSSNSSSKPVQQILVPLFQAKHVNLVLSGNSHNYERTFPLTNGVQATGGITYVVSGAGGNGFNRFGSFTQTYTAFRESSYYEFAKVTVTPTALTVNAVRADTNTVFDSTTITKSSTDTSPPTTPAGLTVTSTSSSTAALRWSPSSDNVGVTGYNVYRDGTRVNSGSEVIGTSFTDSRLTPSTSYRYTVTALDAGGNESPASAPVQATTAAATGTSFTLSPTDDSTIDPASNTPTSTRLTVDAASPTNDMLLKFTAPQTCTNVTAATLTLTVGSTSTNASTHGGDFYATSRTDPNAGWSEKTVTWDTAPARNTAIPAVSLGAVAASTSYSIDVTTLVPSAGGTFTIHGANTSSDGAGYYSKEGSATAGPKLQLSCG
ncbi:MAG: fibronectin type III domain-containing protein [Actinomycetota bacterium]|nr:fibronectin type III domain-containing protein [Actinomycetota bacterium]